MRSSGWSAGSSRRKCEVLKMSADSIVEVKAVGKIYDGGVEALTHVDLALPQR